MLVCLHQEKRLPSIDVIVPLPSHKKLLPLFPNQNFIWVTVRVSAS